MKKSPLITITCATGGILLGWILGAPPVPTHNEESQKTEESPPAALQEQPTTTSQFTGRSWSSIADQIATASLADIENWRTDAKDQPRQRIIRALLNERREELQPSGSDDDLAIDIAAEKDPAATLRAAIRSDNEGFTHVDHFAIRSVMRSIARSDPRLGVSLAKKLKYDDQRIPLIIAYESWAERDPEAAFEATLQETDASDLSARVMEVWIELDPPTAAEQILRKLYSRRYHENSLKHLMYRWARLDAIATRDWAIAISDEGSRNNAIQYLSSALLGFQGAPSTMRAELVASLYDETTPGTTLLANQITEPWAAHDSQTALEWAQSLKTEEERSLATAGVVKALAKTDLSGAADILSKLEYSQGFKQAYATVADAFAQQDPSAAEQWAAALPGQAAEVALESIYARIGNDPANWKFLTERKPSTMRDVALEEMVRIQSKDDPQGAAAKVSSLSKDQRSKAITAIVGNWGHYDPEAAEKWIASLSTAEKISAQRSYAENLAARMPERALTYAKAIPDPKTRSVAMKYAIQRLGELSPEKAVSEWQAAGFSEDSGIAKSILTSKAIVDYLTQTAQ